MADYQQQLDLLQDRITTLEIDHERLSQIIRRGIPFFLPVRPLTRWATIATSVLGLGAILIIASPKQLSHDSWVYESAGVDASVIAAAPSAIAAIVAMISHRKDKEQYIQGGHETKRG